MKSILRTAVASVVLSLFFSGASQDGAGSMYTGVQCLKIKSAIQSQQQSAQSVS